MSLNKNFNRIRWDSTTRFRKHFKAARISTGVRLNKAYKNYTVG